MPAATAFGEPDAGNPHVRFDEGAAHHASASRVALLYSSRGPHCAAEQCAVAPRRNWSCLNWVCFVKTVGSGRQRKMASFGTVREFVPGGWLGLFPGDSQCAHAFISFVFKPFHR